MTARKQSLRDTTPKISEWTDPDDAPKLTEEWFRKAVLTRGEEVIKRGRPPSGNAKQAINIRLSPDVLARFRATGPGWQRRIDEALAEWLAEHGETL